LSVGSQFLREGIGLDSQSILRLSRTLTTTSEAFLTNQGTPHVVIVDYGSHPFIRSTSSRLRSQGIAVTYVYQKCEPCPSYGDLQNRIETGEVGIDIDGVFQKYSYFRRRKQEIEWAYKCVAVLNKIRPTIVFSSCAPLEVQKRLVMWCRSNDVLFVFWLQDIHGVAIRRLLRRKLPVLGELVGIYYSRLERTLLRASDQVLLITDDHSHLMHQYGVDPKRIAVLPNWVLVEELPVLPKNNDWSKQHCLEGTFNFVYSGTLGLKHNPAFLLRLAQHFSSSPGVRVVVISEGLGSDWLRQRKLEEGLRNLVLLPFQPYSILPSALASADVLVVLLERAAAEYSVPSKVLTYLCAERPILMAIPKANLAAHLIQEIGAGIIADPEDWETFRTAADSLFLDANLREKMGCRGRGYAESQFSSEVVCERFRQIVERVLGRDREHSH